MKNLGICAIILGALLLALTMLVPAMADLADQNWYTIGSLVIILAGFGAHIALNKYLPY